MKNKKCICLVFLIFAMALSVILLSKFSTKNNSKYDYENIAGHSFVVSDDSYIVFNKDNSFYWYQSKDNLNDNYYYGSYTIYRGDNAVNNISQNLALYNLTKEDQYSFINSFESEGNNIDLYYNLNLHNEKIVVDGVSNEMSRDTNYYGMAYNDFKEFKMVNMTSSNYAVFLLDK